MPAAKHSWSRPTASACTSPRPVTGRSSCSATAFRSPGTRGATSSAPSPQAGFHAVAPDMRGYGQTDRPEAIDQYTLLHLVGDMVGLLDALGRARR